MDEIKRLKDRLERENAYLQQSVQIRLPQGLVSRSPRFTAVTEAIVAGCSDQFDRVASRRDRHRKRRPGARHS